MEGSNVHDTELPDATIETIMVDHLEPTEEAPQPLCLDKGYEYPTGYRVGAKYRYRPHR